MPSTLKKNCQSIVESGNHYIAAVKGNQPKLLEQVQKHFQIEDQAESEETGHHRLEKRRVSVCKAPDYFGDWAGVASLIRVERYREYRGRITMQTHWYLSSLQGSASEFGARIRGHWGVENKVHYPKDVTFGEDRSRIRTEPLVQNWTVARSFALNLYRSVLMENRAQAQRRCMFGLSVLKSLFRMK